MPHHCSVPLCNSNSSLASCKELSFHKFPRDPQMQKKWVIAIRRDIGPHFQINNSTKVCSKHFPRESFQGSYMGFRERMRLRADAVPSIFTWTSENTVKCRRKLVREPIQMVIPGNGKITSSKPTTILNEEQTDSTSLVQESDTNTEEAAENDTALQNLSFSSDDSLQDIECGPSPDKNQLHRSNLQLLSLRNEEKFTLLRFYKSDSDMKFYTGFPSYKSLHCFYNFLLPEANFLYYVGTQNTSQGTPYMLLNKRGPSRTLSPMEELFVTLVRLRKGLPEKLIADLYSLSEGHVSRILNTWIIFLDNRLHFLPIWPGKEHVKKTMPAIFKEHYPTTRVIVDCTEIFIEHPSAADCQRETFSTYKHNNTAKGLLGISPEGQITFISPLYAGRCSDKKIVRHCGLLELIEEGDGLMVDRGFDIENDLAKRGASLIMPAFLQGQDQFDDKQLSNSRNIAIVRVHVERAVRKVKEFEILRNTVPVTLCPMLEKIWFVCAHLANFTGTLFKRK